MILNPENVRQGLALRPIKTNQTLRHALEGYLARKHSDLFAAWAGQIKGPDGAKLSADYCKGALEMLDAFLQDIDAMIAGAEGTIEVEKEAAEVVQRSGDGRGDLAL